MKKTFILLACLLLFPMLSQSQLKSGIVVGVGDSWMHKSKINSLLLSGEKDLKWDHRFSCNVGYQFQYEFKNHFLIDAALLYQARRVNIAFQEQGSDPNIDYGEQQPGGAVYDKTKLFNGLSLNVAAGYKLWKGLKAGIGVEPTVYFSTKAKANLEDNKFDIPLVVKVGYDFNWFQVDLSYKNGFKRIYRNYVVGNTETRDLQLSVFVPIFK
ncbi:outer membrane beta-barrel protein [uncultured Parabacteroides sp.]|uniref:outer membrane beta-barrel protein n=1 Tax=Parabacteroides sp. ASD2025 TaxID=3415987 RepID=UPI0025F12DFD|nr:outer membrane beta-barrel protein [uncultured Parabacteroides sp.]